jgi:hypothetical protein
MRHPYSHSDSIEGDRVALYTVNWFMKVEALANAAS